MESADTHVAAVPACKEGGQLTQRPTKAPEKEEELTWGPHMLKQWCILPATEDRAARIRLQTRGD